MLSETNKETGEEQKRKMDGTLNIQPSDKSVRVLGLGLSFPSCVRVELKGFTAGLLRHLKNGQM